MKFRKRKQENDLKSLEISRPLSNKIHEMMFQKFVNFMNRNSHEVSGFLNLNIYF